MDEKLYKELRNITDEEKEILQGRDNIDRRLYFEQQSDIINANKLLEQGKIITIRPHTRFIHFPKHTHDYIEVIYMCSGSTTHIINDNKVVLEKGELLFLSMNAVQEILPAKENDVAVNFIILPEFFNKALNMIEMEESPLKDFIIESLVGKKGNIGYLHFKVADVLSVQNLIENLIWTIKNDSLNKRSINQITMGLLFVQLLNNTDRVEVGNNSDDRKLLITILRYIEENYKDGELTNLAKNLNYDVYWISKKIKELTGSTYTDLVQRKRLNQAVYYLTQTNILIADIGLAIGYDNLSYFHRIFKARFGKTPKQYRDNYKK